MSRPAAGDPMPAVVDPMLAALAPDLPAHQERYAFEFKWDGVRAIAFWDGRRLRVQTRNRNDITVRYPELGALGKALGAHRVVLDGEIVALDANGRPSFERLQQRMGLTAPADVARKLAEVPVAYLLFDLVYLDGRLLVGSPYTERRERLAGLGLAGPCWQTPAHRVDDGEEARRASVAGGLEGVIAKRLDSVYEMGRRSGAWLKVKNRQRQELVIAGWTEGEGRRRGLPGSLLVGYFEGERFRYAGRVGTGMDDATLRRLGQVMAALERPDSPFELGRPPSRAHFLEPRLVGEFEFSEWTRGGELRSPSFKGLRDDKDARDVVREVPTGS